MPKKLCGAAVVLPTYPAWSFGTKRASDPEAAGQAGPGAGKYGDLDGQFNTHGTVWDTTGPRWGPDGRKTGPEWQVRSPPYTDRYLKPGYMTGEADGPHWSFGQRHPGGPNANPGPGAYGTWDGPFRQAHATWGPPPRARPPSAPPRTVPMEPSRRRAPRSRLPGASFKGYGTRLLSEETPAPHDYQPNCACTGNCCDMCDKYHGPSFGQRHARPKPPLYPAPHDYHVGCSTLGAAAAGCKSGTAEAQQGRRQRR